MKNRTEQTRGRLFGYYAWSRAKRVGALSGDRRSHSDPTPIVYGFVPLGVLRYDPIEGIGIPLRTFDLDRALPFGMVEKSAVDLGLYKARVPIEKCWSAP